MPRLCAVEACFTQSARPPAPINLTLPSSPVLMTRRVNLRRHERSAALQCSVHTHRYHSYCMSPLLAPLTRRTALTLCCAASGLRAIRPYAIRLVTCCGAYASIRESSLHTLPGRRTGVDQTICGRPMTRKQSSETESSRGVVLENTVGLGSELHRGRVCGAKAFSRRSRTGCGPGA
jgi:hypothetical protein